MNFSQNSKVIQLIAKNITSTSKLRAKDANSRGNTICICRAVEATVLHTSIRFRSNSSWRICLQNLLLKIVSSVLMYGQIIYRNAIFAGVGAMIS